ncbi:hypothetical protein EAF00_004627 [Botryotinia globosa]|nr:hypothetical protein EAF00_004627 [Botryotinia globosa]
MSTTTLYSATKNQCAHCSAPAHMKCTGCSSSLGEETVVTIYYCEKKVKWSTGKFTSLLAKLIRPRSCYIVLARRFRKSSKLFAKRCLITRLRKLSIRMGNFTWLKVDIQIRQARCTCTYGCQDAIAWIQEVTEIFLQGAAQKIEELNVESKNPKREVLIVGPGGEQDHAHYVHSVFKVTPQNCADVYCLDLSGVQFGYYNPVTPWSEYFVDRISSITSCHPSGTDKAMLLSRKQDNSLLDFLHRILGGCSRRTSIAMDAWESKSTLSTFLRFPQGQFEKEKRIMCYFSRFHYFEFRENINEQVKKTVENPGVHPVISFILGKLKAY